MYVCMYIYVSVFVCCNGVMLHGQISAFTLVITIRSFVSFLWTNVSTIMSVSLMVDIFN